MLWLKTPPSVPPKSRGEATARADFYACRGWGNAIYTEFATPGAISVDLGHKRFSAPSAVN